MGVGQADIEAGVERAGRGRQVVEPAQGVGDHDGLALGRHYGGHRIAARQCGHQYPAALFDRTHRQHLGTGDAAFGQPLETRHLGGWIAESADNAGLSEQRRLRVGDEPENMRARLADRLRRRRVSR